VSRIVRLHSGNSATYRPVPLPKHATVRWERAVYKLEMGEQTFDGPHVWVHDADGGYGVDLRVFFSTHDPIQGSVDHYIKSIPVRAVQVTEEAEIETHVRERLEARASISPGGWLIQNPDGEFYYNSAEEFARRYERATDPAKARKASPTLEEHLAPNGAKRILALDGGGIRGRITLGILKRIEDIVGEPLCDYFDLIGGTSTGSIIATGLALGWDVQRLIDLYDGLGRTIFQPGFARLGLWRAKFPAAPLEVALKKHFADLRLGTSDLRTGLVIVTKRLDTNSPWPVHNNPRGRYFGNPPPGKNWIPNKNYLLRQLVRASSAAPHFFDPERIAISTDEAGAFVDGGVSPHNNPALQLVMMATLKGYGFDWALGADRLQVVSLGTGAWRVKHSADQLIGQPAVETARLSLLSLMDDCSALNETLMQWLSDGPTARAIDSEIGDLSNDLLGGGDPLCSYLRYNPFLELEWLKSRLPEEQFDAARLGALREMDNFKSLELLAKIGEAAAEDVKAAHFGL
jgi:hypothetical protein